jgi:hypothetical protein
MGEFVAKRVAGHGLALPLFRLGIPEKTDFHDVVDQLVAHSFKLEQRQRRIREKTLIARRRTCEVFIEGLAQVFSSALPDTAIAIPHSQRFYKSNDRRRISEHTYRNVDACYRALKDLAWISYCPGFVDSFGQSQPTTIAPAGALLERFRGTKLYWKKLVFTFDPIIVRDKDVATGEKRAIPVPDTPAVRQMRQQMYEINEFLGEQAIFLNMPNSQIKALAQKMGSSRYSYEIGMGDRSTRARVLNFSQVGLRRIFSRGRMDRGGRLYGAWWQTIPSEFRRYITINGRATVELDFSEMHPSMLYLLSGQSAPQNIYDLGILRPGDPAYDATVEPHKTRRRYIKKFLNALINDEHRRHRLSKPAQKELGLSHAELLQLILKKYPVIGDALGTDAGLYLQFLDSEIATMVMLELMKERITVIPVHDSFLVQVEFERDLAQAMQKAYAACMNAQAQLKDAELPKDAFEDMFDSDAPQRIWDELQKSWHSEYVKSWRRQHPEPQHQNLAFFAPYKFPDEIADTSK